MSGLGFNERLKLADRLWQRWLDAHTTDVARAALEADPRVRPAFDAGVFLAAGKAGQ